MSKVILILREIRPEYVSESDARFVDRVARNELFNLAVIFYLLSSTMIIMLIFIFI